MKKLLFLLSCSIVLGFTSCKPMQYGGSNAYYGQVNQTQVVLDKANFKVLGSFTGKSVANAVSLTVKDKDGLVSAAKQDFLDNAKAAGITMTGSHAIINTCVDYLSNGKKIVVTFSGEIIEFTK